MEENNKTYMLSNSPDSTVYEAAIKKNPHMHASLTEYLFAGLGL